MLRSNQIQRTIVSNQSFPTHCRGCFTIFFLVKGLFHKLIVQDYPLKMLFLCYNQDKIEGHFCHYVGISLLSLASSGSYKLKLSLLSEPPKPNGEIHKCLFRFKLLENLLLDFEPIAGVDSIWIFYSNENFLFSGKLLFISDFSLNLFFSISIEALEFFYFCCILISYSCYGKALVLLLSNEIVIFFFQGKKKLRN